MDVSGYSTGADRNLRPDKQAMAVCPIYKFVDSLAGASPPSIHVWHR